MSRKRPNNSNRRRSRSSSSRTTRTKVRRPKDQVDASSREVLLIAAKKLFARKGLSGTSIRDIASEARMNSSQISYYFDGKGGLYRACIQGIAEERLKIAEQILRPPETREEFRVRLRLFVENLFHSFLADRDQGLIIIREHDRMHSPAEHIFKSYFNKHYAFLIDFFKSAIRHGFSIDGDPIITTSLFFGMIVSELRFDHIKHALFSRSLRYADERAKVIDSIVSLFESKTVST